MKMAVAWSYNIFWLNSWPHIKVKQQHFLAGTHSNTQNSKIKMVPLCQSTILRSTRVESKRIGGCL